MSEPGWRRFLAAEGVADWVLAMARGTGSHGPPIAPRSGFAVVW
jgi:hypothetical protein